MCLFRVFGITGLSSVEIFLKFLGAWKWFDGSRKIFQVSGCLEVVTEEAKKFPSFWVLGSGYRGGEKKFYVSGCLEVVSGTAGSCELRVVFPAS